MTLNTTMGITHYNRWSINVGFPSPLHYLMGNLKSSFNPHKKIHCYLNFIYKETKEKSSHTGEQQSLIPVKMLFLWEVIHFKKSPFTEIGEWVIYSPTNYPLIWKQEAEKDTTLRAPFAFSLPFSTSQYRMSVMQNKNISFPILNLTWMEEFMFLWIVGKYGFVTRTMTLKEERKVVNVTFGWTEKLLFCLVWNLGRKIYL